MKAPAFKERLTAILAADAAGYSRSIASDVRAAVAELDVARSVFRLQIESNQGRVVDMAGDSVLAVFETATGAVSAALSIQQALDTGRPVLDGDARMRFRVGVHLGDVMEKPDGTVYGDGVNVAARLQALAEPGGIAVSESIRAAVKGKVCADFEDLGEQQIKNIADAVRTFRIIWHTGSNHRSGGTSPALPAPLDMSLPDKPSIAVLAFDNLTGEPEQSYFTDGITEDIITELSRFQSLFVIARNSSFTYKGRAVNVTQVGRELGVRYVLEGSIRRAGGRVRVTAQLVDAMTGNHLWAEKYDRALEDIFAVQEEVTACVVAAVAPRIDAAESLRARRRPGNLSAYEVAVRAWSLAWEGFQNSDAGLRGESLRLARRALAIDRDSYLAMMAIAFVQWQVLALGGADDPKAAWDEGMSVVARAMTIAPSSTCHNCRAFLLAFAPSGGRWTEALSDADAAYQLNAQDAFAVGGCGWIMAVAGDTAEGIRRMERSVRLNPRDPLAFVTHANLAQGNFILRDYRKGLEWALLSRGAAPGYVYAHLHLANLFVGLGDINAARSAFAKARQLAPALIESRLHGDRWSLPSKDYLPRLKAFFRVAAGLDDPSVADALR